MLNGVIDIVVDLVENSLETFEETVGGWIMKAASSVKGFAGDIVEFLATHIEAAVERFRPFLTKLLEVLSEISGTAGEVLEFVDCARLPVFRRGYARRRHRARGA